MSTNRYNQIAIDTKNRYSPISSADAAAVNPVKNTQTVFAVNKPTLTKTQPETRQSSLAPGLNAAGQKAFFSNPYQPNIVVPKPSDTKSVAAPIKVGRYNFIPESSPLINTGVANSTKPVVSKEESRASNPLTFIADIAKGFYDQYAHPNESTIQAEQALGFTPKEKPTTFLGKTEKVVSAPIRTIGKAFVRTFAPMLEPTAETFGQVMATGEISDKVATGELPPEALDTLTALNKKWYNVVGDSTQAVLAAYSPSFFKDIAGNSVLNGLISGAAVGTTFGGAQTLSSGETDPKKIAEILLKSAIAGSVLGTATGYLGKLGADFQANAAKKVQVLDAVTVINQYADRPITKASSLDDIKAAYYSAAKKTHPDIGGDPLAFSDVSQAYKFLTQQESKFIQKSAPTNEPVKGLLEPEPVNNNLPVKENLDVAGPKIKDIVPSEQVLPTKFQTREQFYLDDINKLAEKYKNDIKYQAEKGDDRFFARIADDHFSELNPATQDWLAGQAPGVDFESKNVPNYKGFVNADEYTSGNDSVHGGQITLLKQAVDNQLMGATNLSSQFDTSKSIGELDAEYRATKPGYKNFSEHVDTMVRNKTILPEEATILRTLFEGTNDKLLGDIKFSDNGRLSAVNGKFRYQEKRSGGEIVNPEIQMQKGLSEKGNTQASRTFVHEFGHAGWNLVLTPEERAVVTKVYNDLTPAGRKSLFTHNNDYYAKNVKEFFAQSFSDYVMENKVPAPQMKSLLNRIAGELYIRLRNLISRGEKKAVKMMKPLFEKILKGDSSTPLSEFAAKEPPSFKLEIQKMIEDMAPEVSRQQGVPGEGMFAVTPRAKESVVPKSLFSQPATKQVPVESFFPQIGDSPMAAGEEILQKGTEGLPPDIASTIEPLEAVIEGQKSTPLTERVRWLDYFRTPWKVFDRMKIRPVYQTLLKGYEGYVSELPKNIDKITAWSKMVPAEANEKIFKFLDGEEVSLTPVESRVAKEIKTWLGEWADRLHMKPDERITDYITHIFPFGKGGEIPEEIAFLINKKIPGSVYDPFLLQRQGAKGYIQNTWKALDAYVKRATRKVNMDPALAELKEASNKLTDTSQLDYLNSYIGSINMRPTTMDTLIDNHIKEKFGYLFGARPTATITKSIRMMISRAKIGGSITSFAKNLTQGVNTFAELGGWYTTRGYIDLVKFGKKELDDNGVLVAPFIEDRTYSAVKKMAERFDNVLFLNMNASELVNRGAAYYGAKAKFLNNKVTPKEYREAIGKNMPTDYKPTVEDAIAYGKFISAKTQFLFGPLDTPLALNSDIAKMAAQFQSFGLKQTEFIAKMIGEKEWTKLFRYMLGSMLVFGTVGNAFGMKWQDSFKPMRWGYPPAVQFVIDLYNSGVAGVDKYGRKLKTAERANAFGKTLFTNVVPGGAQIQRSVEGLSTVGAGKSKSAGGTFQYKVNKTPENYVSGALFGKYNIPESQKYYKIQQDKLKGKKTSAPSSGRYNPI